MRLAISKPIVLHRTNQQKRPDRNVCDFSCSGPVASASQEVAEGAISLPPVIGDTLQNFFANCSTAISVNAAINPYSVAVKPSSFFKSRINISNMVPSQYLLLRGNQSGLQV